MSSVLGHTYAWALWGYLLIDEFSSPWKQGSCFLWKLVTMCTPFFQTFLKMCQRVLGGLDLPHTVHAHFDLIPALELCCAYLWEPEHGRLAPEKCCPYLHIASSPAISCSFSQHVITNNPWLLLPTILGQLQDYPAVSMFETCTLAPYLLSFCRHALSVNTVPRNPVISICPDCLLDVI